MPRKSLALALLGIVLLAGAAAAQTQTPLPSKPSNNAYDAAVARHLETARMLARAGATSATDEPSIDWISGLTSDRRASRINDLITVRVIENIESSASADSALDKRGSGSAGVPTLFGLETKFPSAIDPSNLMSTNSETVFKGSGTTTRASMLTATMTARGSEVLPNGDLMLESVKELDLNGERQVVVLTGVVRAQDLRGALGVFLIVVLATAPVILPFLFVQELALEVVAFNPVEIGYPQRADARGGEVERGGAAEPAGAHHQNSGRRELALPSHANLRQRQMPAVPGEISRGELGRRCHPRYARVMRARRK